MKRKKKKTGLVIFLILLLLILAGAGVFAYLYFTRPILKINKAIEEDDIETVSELYSSLSKESEMLDVQDRMLDKCKELEQGFVDEELDYDFVSDQLDVLGKEILEDNSRYEKIVKNVNILNTSRLSFDEGMEAFEKEDYEAAIEAFSRVIKDDDNFDKAQAKIEECRELMKPDITGSYRAKIDLSQALMQLAGFSGTSPLPLNIDIVLEFVDDSNGCFYMDVKDPEGLYDSMVKVITFYAKKSLAQQYGISEDNLDNYAKMFLGKSVEDLVKDEMNLDDLKDSLYLDKTFFIYTLDEDAVQVVQPDSNDTLELDIHDDDLYLEESSAGSLAEISSYGIEFPLIFSKE